MRSSLAPRLAALALILFSLNACGGSNSGTTLPTTGSNVPQSSSVSPMSKGGGTSFQLPLSAFLSAQGQFTISSGFVGNLGFDFAAENAVSGCPNGEGLYNLVGSVDYAGLINNYLVANGVPSLGTTETGTVTVQPQANGTAIVSVEVRTAKAYAFVTCYYPATNTSLALFGHSRAETIAGMSPAIGSSEFRATFTMPTPTSPLPDLIQLTFYASTLPGYSMGTTSFHSTATGQLRSQFGVTDGTLGSMSLEEQGTMKVGAGEDKDAFAAEQLNLNVLK